MKIVRQTLIAATLILALVGCGAGPVKSAPETVTVTPPQSGAPAPQTITVAPSATTAAEITIPEVADRNAEIVRKELEKLGLKSVNLSSANPKYKMVVNAANWTAVSIEPAPGTVVSADDTVILKVTKP